MIDVKDGSGKEKWVTFFCPECEALYGSSMELRVDYSDRSKAEMSRRRKMMERFEKVHEHCGERELDLRLATYINDPGDEKLKFCQACYAEDPKMPFTEIQNRWKELGELKAEWKREHQ